MFLKSPDSAGFNPILTDLIRILSTSGFYPPVGQDYINKVRIFPTLKVGHLLLKRGVQYSGSAKHANIAGRQESRKDHPSSSAALQKKYRRQVTYSCIYILIMTPEYSTQLCPCPWHFAGIPDPVPPVAVSEDTNIWHESDIML